MTIHTRTLVENVAVRRRHGHLHLRRRAGRGRLPRHRRRPRPRRRGARPRRGRRQARRPRADRGRRRACAPPPRASTRSATSSRARRSPTRPPTRASSPSRTPPAWRPTRSSYVDIPRATFCTPNVALLRPHRGAGARAGHRRRRRQGPVRRGRRRHRLRRPHAASSRSSATRRYGELVGGHIVGAKATELIQELVNAKALEGGYRRGGAHRPRPPDALRGRHGGGPRRGRLAHPRLAVDQPRFYFDLASPEAYLAAERVMHVLPRGSRVDPGALGGLPPAASARSAAPRRSRPTARTSSAAPRRYELQPVRWPEPFPFDTELGDARGHLREADRPRRRVLARRVPAGVRRRPRPRRPRQRADRRRRRARCTRPRCSRAPSSARSPPRLQEATAEAAAAGVLDVPAVAIDGRVFHGDRELERAAAAGRA